MDVLDMDQIYLGLQLIRDVFPIDEHLVNAQHSFSLTHEGKVKIGIHRANGPNKVLTLNGGKQFYTKKELEDMRDQWIIEDVNKRMHQGSLDVHGGIPGPVGPTGAMGPMGPPGVIDQTTLTQSLGNVPMPEKWQWQIEQIARNEIKKREDQMPNLPGMMWGHVYQLCEQVLRNHKLIT